MLFGLAGKIEDEKVGSVLKVETISKKSKIYY